MYVSKVHFDSWYQPEQTRAVILDATPSPSAVSETLRQIGETICCRCEDTPQLVESWPSEHRRSGHLAEALHQYQIVVTDAEIAEDKVMVVG